MEYNEYLCGSISVNRTLRLLAGTADVFFLAEGLDLVAGLDFVVPVRDYKTFTIRNDGVPHG